MKDPTPFLASFGHLIRDGKIFAESFHKINFSHVRHEGNFVAHKLARHAIHVISSSVWMEDVPPHFHAVIQVDLVVVSE